MSIAKSCMKIATGESVDGLDDYAPKKKRKEKIIVKTNADNDGIVIHEDDRNYRKHNKRNLDLIDRSVTNNGVGRPIFADNSGKIIGGNGTFKITEKHGIPQRIIHSNGDELIIVVRDDVSPDDPRRAELAIMDNSTTDSSEFDFDLLNADFDLPQLQDLGVEMPEMPDNNSDDVPDMDDIEIPEAWEVVCECDDEESQQELFERLTAEGVKCRILTL